MADSSKHGKQGHGARFSKKQLGRDLTQRLNEPGKRTRSMPDEILLVDLKSERVFWYWRRKEGE